LSSQTAPLVESTLDAPVLPEGAAGIDAGLTLTKVVVARDGRLHFSARETGAGAAIAPAGAISIGVTGARSGAVPLTADAVQAPEIDAAARGVRALRALSGADADEPFVLALLGTGTAFAAVRDGKATHLGGTPLGGGSFSGIARRVDGTLAYAEMIAAAHRGDRRAVDAMVADAYPDGIGRIGPDLTAAHLEKATHGSLDDFLAGLLNLHAENIAQIAASRARIAQIPSLVLAGGFAHHNARLVEGITSMAALFGVSVAVSPAPGFAGAVGAALMAVDANETEVSA
jgi:type II pantothenate kinase